MLSGEMWLECAVCREVRPFEQPPCPDGHGADCPEWACTACGFAVLVDPPVPAYAAVEPDHRAA